MARTLEDMQKTSQTICGLLLSTKREGMDAVVKNIVELGFFSAPASVANHLNYEGGLAEHSYNVCEMAMKLRACLIEKVPDVASRLERDSVVVASLLHDVCKADIYKSARKFKKNDEGRWESYAGYNVDYSHMPYGHGEKSVIMLLRWGLRLTDDEIMAIRWHMSAWDLAFQSYEQRGCLSAAAVNCPLLAVIQAADGLSAHVLEV